MKDIALLVLLYIGIIAVAGVVTRKQKKALLVRKAILDIH